MKKIILLWFILIIESATAAETEEAFCINKVQNQHLQIADIWLVYTHNLDKNPVLGQFYKYGYSSLEENSLTMSEIEIFLTNYGTKLRFGPWNYFLLKQNGLFFILSVERTEEKLFFQLKTLDELITQQAFIYIMIPQKNGV